MSSRIHLLSALLANQIAAGEIIERPSAVVKELLENSLDAGATRIDIELEKGGKQLICIHDNGSGIHPDDLRLAVSRHATSKIASLADLTHVQSLGFRGEALASIAAVSQFQLISAITDHPAQQLSGMNDNFPLQLSPAAHPRGSTTIARELFFNTPARRRFLRSDKTEFLHALDIVHKIALSRSAVAITLRHNKKLILRFSAAENLAAQSQRVAKICGQSFMQASRHFSTEAQDLTLQGWLIDPAIACSHANTQYFFLNGRIVRDKLLNHAMRVAMQEHLPAGRYLAYVLHFSCDAGLVDVNVHPTKHEVRFQDPRLVHDFIVHALCQAWQPSGIEDRSTVYDSSQARSRPSELLTATTQVSLLAAAKPEPYDATSNPIADAAVAITHPWGSIVGLIHRRYLLLEIPGSLAILDCFRANEFIYRRQLLKVTATQPLASKALLWPISLSLTSLQTQALQNQTIDWQAFGIDWQVSSKQQIIIRRLPTILAAADPAALFTALSSAIAVVTTLIRFAAQTQLLHSLEQQQQLLQELAGCSSVELKKIQRIIPLNFL